MIQSLIMRGIKNANGKQELTGRDIIIGHNGAGKTTRAQALGIALLGYVPGGGKLPAETMKLAHGDNMTVGVETDSFSFTRSFERKGSEVKSTVTLNPPSDEKTIKDKERRIEAELGKLPVMLDFNEFLNLSDMKRREFIYALVGGDDGDKVNKDFVVQALIDRLRLPETADPQEIEALENDIKECATAYLDTENAQAGLQAMLTYAMEQLAYWKKEREKAVGASQKISDYKNTLTETDRNLDANNKQLEEAQEKLRKVVSDQATANNENLRIAAVNKKIAALKTEIESIEQSTHTGSTADLRELIAQYRTDLRQIDNSAAYAAVKSYIESTSEQVAALEKEVEACRDEYQAIKSDKTANETLLEKLRQQKGTFPIDCRIECDKDFSSLIEELEAENEEYRFAAEDITEIGTQTRAKLEEARKGIQEAKNNVDKLREEEILALRENEGIQAIIRDYEDEIVKIESFEATKDARLTSKREEMAGMLPQDGESEWTLIDTEPIVEHAEALEEEIANLKEKITEQTKARNTLVNLKNSMVDSIIAGYHVDAWKRISDAVGPKGLQGEIIKDALSPLTEAIQSKLAQMNIKKTFYFQTVDSKGKEVFQFGWKDEDNEQRNFDALSTGEQMLLLISLMITIIERLNPPLKVLCIDNAENLDSGNIKHVLNGLTTAGESLDNIIFSGVMNINPADVEGWRVWDLGGVS